MIILITGGAGFIGSNLVANLIENDTVTKIKVIDDLSTGYIENIEPFLNHPKFEFLKADICDFEQLLAFSSGVDVISHQAALGSVPRSISAPLRSNEVNISGTLNVLYAAVQNKIDRVVLACSSSTYGDSTELPKVEGKIGRPLSPYAVTKYAIELYADVFNRTYGLNYIGLRYFNVFGPRQNPNNPYAAVIPLFCKSYLSGIQPVINGEGFNTRDFTYIYNAVQANKLAMFTKSKEALNNIYNVACGERTSLIQITEYLREISGKEILPLHREARKGDIPHSLANIDKIKSLLSYEPTVYFKEGLSKVYQWYSENLSSLR